MDKRNLTKEQEEFLRKHRPWLFEEIDPAVRILLQMLGISEEEYKRRKDEKAKEARSDEG